MGDVAMTVPVSRAFVHPEVQLTIIPFKPFDGIPNLTFFFSKKKAHKGLA
jgi:hypothetical protein